MKVSFNIEYRTVFGEELFLNYVVYDSKGNAKKEDAIRMSTAGGSHWSAELSFPIRTSSYTDYYYSVRKDGADERREWAVVPHRVDFVQRTSSAFYIVYDNWKDIPEDSYLYSSAFTNCVSKMRLTHCGSATETSLLYLTVRAPQLRQGQRLALVGSDVILGGWNVHRGVAMTDHHYGTWVACIDRKALSQSVFEFKFVILSESAHTDPIWENGANRIYDVRKVPEADVIVNELPQAAFPLAPWRAAGTVIPVFSLRSRDSFGVGDFGDLRKMISWVAQTGQQVLQLLPLNDTTMTHTWSDSYPYSSISIYALHPQYVSLNDLSPLKDKKLSAKYAQLQKELNALPQVDYDRMMAGKMAYLHDLFAQEGAAVLKSAAFTTFFAANGQWLVPYAAFCSFRDEYGTAKFNTWPEHRSFSEEERKDYLTPGKPQYKKVAFYYFVQFILDTQLRNASAYARSKGVVLKGDIPIGISRDSVEAWEEPQYFNLNGQAGAPPDAFSANGQNWGFPTYNWDLMLKDGCSWWVRRFRKMSEFFDAYRIDHILGFFRIWEIPINAVHGLLGHFSPALALSPQDIDSYNLYFREDFFTEPFITDWVVDRVFGKWADEVRSKYLVHTHDDMYKMAPEYDTQRKVESAFAGKTTDDDVWIRDGLYALISDVLFVRDHKNQNLFHPRIGVQLDFVFQALSDDEKNAFNRLYNDYFYRRNNLFWYTEAMKKLPLLIQATRMLVCGEDLGMVPDCVPWVMNELRILSLEIQSMPKDIHCQFGNLSANPYRSVSTISTHDMPTMRMWWKEDRGRAQRYYNDVLGHQGEAPEEMPGWLAKEILSRHLGSQSMLCLLSWQDWMAMDEERRLKDADAERINIPSNPHHYWRYRMHISIEDLLEDTTLNKEITTLIQQNSRS